MNTTPNSPFTNDFFIANLRAGTFTEDDETAMSEAEQNEFFELFAMDDLPDAAMSAEMADGYLTARWIGPELPLFHDTLATIFGQTTLPICADAAKQARLLALISSRWRDIQRSTGLEKSELTKDTLFLPMTAEIDPADCIAPYKTDEHGERVGEWSGKDWVAGFVTALRQDPLWEPLVNDPENHALLTPFILLDTGFNPDRKDWQLDDHHDNVLGTLVQCVYQIHTYWKDFRRNAIAGRDYIDHIAHLPFQRETPKTGRNDPCICGSGKKFKKILRCLTIKGILNYSV